MRKTRIHYSKPWNDGSFQFYYPMHMLRIPNLCGIVGSELVARAYA